jgi:glutaredoxin 2
MITLYIKSPCQYSARAIAAFDTFNVPFTEKNIADPVYEAELLEIGGRHKVPFMIDGDTHLYESEDIVAYIEKKYGNGAKVTKPVVHRNDATETCGI